jgi:hypothetical protein
MTQQFWKGLATALISVIVAAFAVQPINWILLAVTAVSTTLTYAGKNIFVFFHSDSPAGSLSWINLASGLLIAIGTGILEGFSTYFVEGVVVWNLVWKVVAAASFTYLGTTFFAPQHSKTAVRGFVSPTVARSLMKASMVLVLFFAIGIGASAQSKWDGFFKPVTNETLQKVQGDKAMPGTFLFRPSVTLVATEFRLGYGEDGSFDGLNSSYLSKTGIGISYAHYIDSQGEPFNDYSINGMLMFPTEGQTNLGVALTVSALRYINVGFGYDIIKGVPFKQNIFFLTGVQYTF